MQIVLSANRPNIDSEIDSRFGRCRYLIFVDPETMQYEAEENPHLETPSGAGISTAQLVANKGAKALITGNVGPNAYQVLTAAGIELFTGVSGKIRDVVEIYRSGGLMSSQGPTGSMGMGRGMRQGGGMGRGMGCGRGRGRGLNAGQTGTYSGSGGRRYPGAVAAQGSGEEIAHLKNQADALAEELARIQQRIRQMETQ